MVFKTREIEGVVVFDIKGDIIRSQPLILHQAVKEMLERGKIRILLNLEKMGFIDSSGTGEIVAGHTSVTNIGGEFKLARISARFRLILEITGIIEVLAIYDTVEAALAAFTRP